jgi:hypothetical protein
VFQERKEVLQGNSHAFNETSNKKQVVYIPNTRQDNFNTPYVSCSYKSSSNSQVPLNGENNIFTTPTSRDINRGLECSAGNVHNAYLMSPDIHNSRESWLSRNFVENPLYLNHFQSLRHIDPYYFDGIYSSPPSSNLSQMYGGYYGVKSTPPTTDLVNMNEALMKSSNYMVPYINSATTLQPLNSNTNSSVYLISSQEKRDIEKLMGMRYAQPVRFAASENITPSMTPSQHYMSPSLLPLYIDNYKTPPTLSVSSREVDHSVYSSSTGNSSYSSSPLLEENKNIPKTEYLRKRKSIEEIPFEVPGKYSCKKVR